MKKIQFCAFVLFSLLLAGCNQGKEKEKLIQQISNYRNQEQYAEALEKSNALVQKFPKDSRVHVILGDVLAAMGRWPEAKQEFSKAIELDPQNVNAYLLRLGANIEMNLPLEALADCPQVIKSQPVETVYNECALAAFKSKDHKQAIEYYSKVLELNPQNAEANYYRKVSENLLRDKNETAKNLFNEAASHYQQGNFEEAIKIFDILIQEVPNSTVFYLRGMAKFKRGDFHGAQQDYTQAIALDPNDGRAYMMRCSAKARLQDYQGMIEDCERVVSLSPNDPLLVDAYSAIIAAKFSLQDYSGAYQASQRAIQDMPNVFDFYVLQLTAIRDFEEKLKACGEILPLYEQKKAQPVHVVHVASAYKLCAAVKHYFYKEQEALQDYTKSLAIYPQADVYQKRGEIKELLGDKTGAQEDFQQAETLAKQGKQNPQ